MEKIKRKVSFNKGGGTTGGISVKTSLPMAFIKELEVTKEDPYISIYKDGDKIIIEKLKSK